jgi:hypothetical protein
VPRCIARSYKVAKREKGREMGERGGDITKHVMEKKKMLHIISLSFSHWPHKILRYETSKG